VDAPRRAVDIADGVNVEAVSMYTSDERCIHRSSYTSGDPEHGLRDAQCSPQKAVSRSFSGDDGATVSKIAKVKCLRYGSCSA
jgi:hypothetical protein